MKYFCLTLLSVFLAFASFATSPISGSKTACVGLTTQLSDATPGGMWSSSALFIATVGSSGTVTGVSAGTCIITYNVSGVLAMVTMTVNPLTPIIGNTTICAGLTTKLSDPTLGGTWSSNTPSVATVGSTIGIATVTAVAPGTDTIFYTLATGCVASAIITVNPLPGAITGTESVCVGQTTTLTDPTYNGTWTSSIPATAKVGRLSGVVTGVAAGAAAITYMLPTGCITTATVTVNPLPLPITGPNETYHGNSTTLTDATPGGNWSVADPTYVSITSGGIATGITAGGTFVFYTLPATGCFTAVKYIVDPFPDSGATFPIVAWYPFCADNTDHSGNGNNLTNGGAGRGAATLTIDSAGYGSAAYAFSNAGNTQMTHAFYTTATATGDFTYSCWIYPTVAQASIIWYDGSPSIDGFGLVMNNGVIGVPGTKVGIQFGGIGLFLPTDLSTINPVPLNHWYFVVVTKHVAQYQLYINGIPEGFYTSPMNTPGGGENFTLGNDYTLGAGVNTSAYTGKIDDVGVFNDWLTDNQRDDLYNFRPDEPPFTLGHDTTICSGVITLRPTPQIPGSFYIWSTADTLDTSIVVYPVVKSGTVYTLDISRPYSCTSSASIDVSLRPLPINLGNDTNICQGDTVLLKGYYPGATYLWNTGDTTNFLKVFLTGNYFVTIDSGVCKGSDSIFVTTWRTPLVDLGPDVSNCTGTPFEVHNSYPDIAYDNGYTYLWSNGASTDSLLTNTSGTFWLQVSNHGCPQSDTVNVLIVFDTFSFHSVDTQICAGRFVTANATFNPIVSYQWTPTTGIPLSTVPGPNITPDTSAEYYLRGTYPGCPDILDSFFIDVQPYPMVNIGGNRPVCEFDTLHINAAVTPNWYAKYFYHWTPTAFIDDTAAQNIVFTAGDSVDLTLVVSTSAGCKGSDSMLISVHPGGFDSAILNYNVCPNDSIQLSTIRKTIGNTLGTVANYEWHPGVFLTDSTAAQPWLHAINDLAYTVIGTSTYGCKDTLHFNVKVDAGAVLYLGDSVTLHPGETYQISPQTNCVWFHWFPSYGINDTSIADPIVAPNLNTRYIVHAKTEYGCPIVDSISIHYDPSTLLSIPNAFTPNGNVNQVLSIIKDGQATLHYFRIYNRWGIKVFESTSVDQGWDGNFNGAPQPFGVYVYEAEAVTNSGRVFTQKGNITLIR